MELRQSLFLFNLPASKKKTHGLRLFLFVGPEKVTLHTRFTFWWTPPECRSHRRNVDHISDVIAVHTGLEAQSTKAVQ